MLRVVIELLCCGAQNGHLHMLKWAVENGCECDVQATARHTAASVFSMSYTRADFEAISSV